MFFKKKKGDVLIQNVIFIILNLIFLTLLMVFLWQKSSGAAVLEESYSKQISLLLDTAEPVMQIKLGMEDAMSVAENNNFDFSKAVSITGNTVHVQLRDKGGDSYSFFNDVRASAYPETNSQNEYTGNYVIIVNKKN